MATKEQREKNKKLRTLKKRLEILEEYYQDIEAKIRDRILNEDVDSYEITTDLGKNRTTRGKIGDMLRVQKEYKAEMEKLKYQIRKLENKEGNHVLIRF